MGMYILNKSCVCTILVNACLHFFRTTTRVHFKEVQSQSRYKLNNNENFFLNNSSRSYNTVEFIFFSVKIYPNFFRPNFGIFFFHNI